MEGETGRFQLFLRGTDFLYYASNSISVILRAYEMYQFKQNLELRIVDGDN